MKITTQAQVYQSIRDVKWCCQRASVTLSVTAEGTILIGNYQALFCPFCGEKVEVVHS